MEEGQDFDSVKTTGGQTGKSLKNCYHWTRIKAKKADLMRDTSQIRGTDFRGAVSPPIVDDNLFLIVILNEVKDLMLFKNEILRFAQKDKQTGGIFSSNWTVPPPW